MVGSASNRNQYEGYLLRGKGGRGVGLTTLPSSCADCLEILTVLTSCSPKGLPKPVTDYFTLLEYDAVSHANKSNISSIPLRKPKHSLALKTSLIYGRISKSFNIELLSYLLIYIKCRRLGVVYFTIFVLRLVRPT